VICIFMAHELCILLDIPLYESAVNHSWFRQFLKWQCISSIRPERSLSTPILLSVPMDVIDKHIFVKHTSDLSTRIDTSNSSFQYLVTLTHVPIRTPCPYGKSYHMLQPYPLAQFPNTCRQEFSSCSITSKSTFVLWFIFSCLLGSIVDVALRLLFTGLENSC
jgi:hypothetical protein